MEIKKKNFNMREEHYFLTQTDDDDDVIINENKPLFLNLFYNLKTAKSNDYKFIYF